MTSRNTNILDCASPHGLGVLHNSTEYLLDQSFSNLCTPCPGNENKTKRQVYLSSRIYELITINREQ